MNYNEDLPRIDERNAVEIYGAYKFVKLLATPWEDWEAFKLGLIDSSGNKIRKAKTTEEKKAFGLFDIVVRNIKQMVERLPFGKTRVASYAAALFLMREHFTGIEEFSRELNEQLGDSECADALVVESSGRFAFATDIYKDIIDTSGMIIVDENDIITINDMTFYVGKDIITKEKIIVPSTMLENI